MDEIDGPWAKSLCSRLDALEASDLGIQPDEAKRLQGTGTGVGYVEVYSGPEVTLCIFVMEAGARIPLHDHPEMYVFGRQLFGKMRVVSYGWEDGPAASARARLHDDAVLGPLPTTYSLGPGDGNIHELHALEDSAFFDVVLPPYDPARGRDCTYYVRSTNCSAESSGDCKRESGDKSEGLLLVPRDVGDFSTARLDYRGPQFVPPS